MLVAGLTAMILPFIEATNNVPLSRVPPGQPREMGVAQPKGLQLVRSKAPASTAIEIIKINLCLVFN